MVVGYIWFDLSSNPAQKKSSLLNKAPLPLTSDTVDLIFNLTVNVLLSREHCYGFQPRLCRANGRTIIIGYCTTMPCKSVWGSAALRSCHTWFCGPKFHTLDTLSAPRV